jgi:hypothetical protein
MPVYIIQSTDLFPDGNHRFAYIETYHPDLHSLTSDLRGGPVCVTRLSARREGEEMIVTDRRSFTFTPAYVFSISEPDRPFVEFEEGGET